MGEFGTSNPGETATMESGTALSRPMRRRNFLRLAAAAGVGATFGPGLVGDLSEVHAASPNLSFSLLSTTTDGQGSNAVIALYQKLHTDADISVTLSNAFSNLLRLRLAAGTAPDIFEVSPGNGNNVCAQVLAPAGYLVDLSAEPWVKQIPAPFRLVTDYYKKTVFLPTGLGFMTMMYNKKVFQKVGVTPPTTYSGFLAVCDKVKKAGYVPIALGDAGGFAFGNLCLSYAMAASCAYAVQPTLAADLTSGKSTFAKSGWRTTLEQIQEFNKRGYFNKYPEGTQYAAAETMLATGKAAMMAPISNVWYDLVAKAGGSGDVYGAFPYPGDEVPAHAWVAAGLSYGLGISAHSKNIEGAKTFLRFVSQAANLAVFDAAAGELPYRGDVKLTEPDALATALKLVSAGKAAVYHDQLWPNANVQAKLVQGTSLIITGSKTVDAVLQDMDKAFAGK
jgi:raffinose/stachyose/melibiose transport system substrate-binding protein